MFCGIVGYNDEADSKGVLENIVIDNAKVEAYFNHKNESGFDPNMSLFTGVLCGVNSGIINKVTVKNSSIKGVTNERHNSGTAEAWVAGVSGSSNSKYGIEIENALSINNRIESKACGGYYRWGNSGTLKSIAGGVVSLSRSQNSYFVSLDNEIIYTTEPWDNIQMKIAQGAGILIGCEEKWDLYDGVCSTENASCWIIGNKNEDRDYGYSTKHDALVKINEQWPQDIWKVDLDLDTISIRVE